MCNVSWAINDCLCTSLMVAPYTIILYRWTFQIKYSFSAPYIYWAYTEYDIPCVWSGNTRMPNKATSLRIILFVLHWRPSDGFVSYFLALHGIWLGVRIETHGTCSSTPMLFYLFFYLSSCLRLVLFWCAHTAVWELFFLLVMLIIKE